MTNQQRWYAGVDWASENHHVRITDGNGRTIGEKIFRHGGEGLSQMADWLMAVSGAERPGQIQIAIEVPHGQQEQKDPEGDRTVAQRGLHPWCCDYPTENAGDHRCPRCRSSSERPLNPT